MFGPIRRVAGILTPKTITLGTALALASVSGLYALKVRNRIRQTNPGQIQSSLKLSDSFNKSHTIRNLVNPRNHVTKGDSHSIVLTLCPKHGAPSEEDVLSTFLKGFFAGPVFLPEGIALSLFSILKLPPKGTTLWDTFQIAESKLSSKQAKERTGSSVDVVFGDCESEFAGCHRFSVQKASDGNGPEEDGIRFRVSLECLVCNPLTDRQAGSDFLHVLHNKYSYLLFRDAVAHIKEVFANLA
ncbi:uncharacterized protein TRIREDRAFT_70996 [Trichoderma reesei QM6a]|uniref:Predicted protein n=1 Tax=Hypocrea jecorina (strain QM6a) TaxID=431241 RepID=G0RXH0_HYPJQ|nr:uncharacterized protein TRIREDRAFT_70996 [Trichoderma reesei QM6a]EGR44127.1 predicted protein [Trichoderma reesei QM6a]